ncbi:MAG: S-layer homology domain-containing protein [Eubacteriales bacterium]|nr:S-layer homology domain-containing protein [Eubacteriales bacterium]
MDRKLRGMRKLVSVLVILCMLTSLAAVTGPVFAAEEDMGLQGASTEGINMIQMLTSEEDPGDGEGPPIYGGSDLKTTHQFPGVKGTFAVHVPEDGEREAHDESCGVSFIPTIEECETPFYIANGLHGVSVFTIRDSDVDQKVAISNIEIERGDLLKAGEPRITFSEGYDNDTRGEIFYYIYLELDFYSLKEPDKLIGTLEYEVQVYDSPSIGVDVNYDGEISSYDEYGISYVEGDIWNSKVNIKVIRDSADDSIEPVAGALTNIYYFWGKSSSNMNKPFCIFKPIPIEKEWIETGLDGIATFTIGGGGFSVDFSIGVSSPALYGKLVNGSGQDSLDQYYTYPDLKDFEGTLKVRVVNTFGEPLKGRNVQIWGGVKFDHSAGATTDDQGIATIRYPSTTVSTQEKELKITELPTFSLKWNITQVIDNPSRIVEGHNAPLYLSPEVYVSEGYSTHSYMEVRGVELQVYDTEDPERVLIKTPAMAFQEKYINRDITIFGSHRAYIKISPKDWADKKLGIRAVVANKDEGAREKYQVRSYVEDKTVSRELYEPKKTFTFAYVPLRVGAEENNSSVSYSGLGPQKEYIRKILPAPIKFVEKSPMFIAKPRFSTHNMYLSRIFRELDRERKRFPDKYDLYIGMTPKGFLGAAGLQDSGYFGMNWDFLGAAHGAVLIDPSQVLPHTTLHEFLHTLGFADVYPEGDDQLPSANGHDGTPINNVAGQRPSNQAILYDVAANPWPTEAEYEALLEYATKPKSSGGKSMLRMNAFSQASQAEVLLLSGMIEDARSNQRKVDLDTIIKHAGDSDAVDNPGSNDYVIQTLDSEGNVLSKYFFSDYVYDGKYYAKFMANLPAENVHAIEIRKYEYGEMSQLFQRYEYSTNPPEVSLTGPDPGSLSGDFFIAWQASDDDGDHLRSEVQVSSDKGSTWDIIASNIPGNVGGNYSYAVNARTFPTGEEYKFKVVVTDGMHFVEAVSDGEYVVEGYEPEPKLNLSSDKAEIKVKSGNESATAYFKVGNEGKEELSLVFSPDAMAANFVSPLFVKEYVIYSGEEQIIEIPLVLTGVASGTLEGAITLTTNDPEFSTTDLTVKIEYLDEEADLNLGLAHLLTRPADFSKTISGSALEVTFDAYAEAGQRGLEATLIIEDKDGNEILEEDLEAQTRQMVENNHKPGSYTYHWEREEGLPAGDYGVYIDLKDTQVSPPALRVREDGQYDLEFTIKEPNGPPVFVTPNTYENDFGVVERGEKVTIPYQVSDPEGDELDIEVYSNLLEHGLEFIEDTENSGRIEWTANVSGVHSIYLTATDPSGNSAEVMFNIVEAEDLNVYTISVEANPSHGGQVYGGGLYNPGDTVTVEAVPAESFEFINWTEDGTVVSTDQVHMFSASSGRELVANFAELAVFKYISETDEIIITGFADELDELIEDIVIPNEIQGCPVTGIKEMAFWSKEIKSVVFPETLATIGTNAFHTNKLTEVILPESVTTIDDYAFGFNENLVKVVIPNPNVTIGEGAFAGGSSDLIIYGVPGSSAEEYATTNGITFIDISDYEGTLPTTKYNITVADVEGGTAEVTTDKTEAKADEIVTVTITNIESGKQFKSIAVRDADNGNVTTTAVTAGSEYTYTMPAKAVTVTVELEDESVVTPENYTVTLEGAGTGSTGAGNYAENDVVTINAGTRSGYTFNGWTSTDVTFANANAQITTFTMPAKNVTVTATWKIISNDGSSGGGGSAAGPEPQEKEHEMGRETTTGTTTTSVVDREKLESYVETAEKGSGILIPISENKIATAQLPLNTFEIMAEKEMTLTILSGPVAIDVPTSSIDTDAIKGLLGAEGSDADISLSITIAQPSSDETASLHTAAESEGLEMLGTPVVFNITASYNGETVVIASFKQYVQRRLEVSKEIAENVTTALVFEADNTFRPVPTSVYLEGGKYYVIVSSRTNSTYVLVIQNSSFGDTEGKWYKDIVKEMADRQVIRGIGNNVFAGDREITRAEFAAIMIRALGLPAKGMSAFSDVAADSWYNQTVAAATQYGIVSGKGDNRFDPLAKITREEAMQIVFNASKLIPINGVREAVDSKAYSDYNAKSQWSTEAVDFNLNNGLIVGSNGKINPKANITRGEAATVILKLLQKANLVNSRTDG